MNGVICSLIWIQSIYGAALSLPAFDPVGERACYAVDRDQERTIGAVRGGWSEVHVASSRGTSTSAITYQIEFRAVVQLLFFGVDKAGFTIDVPGLYFTPEFMSHLKQLPSQTFVTKDFKMTWLETANVTTLSGLTYSNADRVRIYDIDTTRAIEVWDAHYDVERPVIRDLTIDAYIHPDVPALGAVKLNMNGIRYGIRLWAGMDFTEDQNLCVTNIDLY